MPHRVIADAGYGSEANYEYLEREGIEAYVKYNLYDQQQTRAFGKQIFRVENLPYDAEHDRYTCPAGQHLAFVGVESTVSENGYRSHRHLYQAKNCNGCRLREQCHRVVPTDVSWSAIVWSLYMLALGNVWTPT